MSKLPKYSSITKLMKETLKAKPDMQYEDGEKLIKKFFPESLFNRKHFSWYKAALKRGALKGVR